MHTLTTRLQEHAHRMWGEAAGHVRDAKEADSRPPSGWDETDRINQAEAAGHWRQAARKVAYARYAEQGQFARHDDDEGMPYVYAHAALHGDAAAESRTVALDAANRPITSDFRDPTEGRWGDRKMLDDLARGAADAVTKRLADHVPPMQAPRLAGAIRGGTTVQT